MCDVVQTRLLVPYDDADVGTFVAEPQPGQLIVSVVYVHTCIGVRVRFVSQDEKPLVLFVSTFEPEEERKFTLRVYARALLEGTDGDKLEEVPADTPHN